MPNLQQTCKVCSRPDKFDFFVPNPIWESIVPSEFQNGVVCLSCFDDFADHKNVDYAHYIDILFFAGKQATFFLKPETRINKSEYRDYTE